MHHTATRCNTLQHTTTLCNLTVNVSAASSGYIELHCNTLENTQNTGVLQQHTVKHCNTVSSLTVDVAFTKC